MVKVYHPECFDESAVQEELSELKLYDIQAAFDTNISALVVVMFWLISAAPITFLLRYCEVPNIKCAVNIVLLCPGQ